MNVFQIKTVLCQMGRRASIVAALLLLSAAPGYAKVDQAATAVSDSAQSVSEGLTELQQRVSESRLINQPIDDIVAFFLIAVLLYTVLGIFSKILNTGEGPLKLAILGLCGSFVGGMVVRLTQVDLGWGVAAIGYEELLFSLVSIGVVVGIGRLIHYLIKRKPKPKAKS